MLQSANARGRQVRPLGRLTARTLTDDQMQAVSGASEAVASRATGKITKVHTSVDIDFEDGGITD